MTTNNNNNNNSNNTSPLPHWHSWLALNESKLPNVLVDHLRWVANRTRRFEDEAVLEIPPTMKLLKEMLKKGRGSNSGDSNSNSNSMEKVFFRKPTILPMKRPLRSKVLREILSVEKGKVSGSNNNNNENGKQTTTNIGKETVECLCEALQGFYPGAIKAPLENWFFDSFLCTAEEILPGLWLGGFVVAHDQGLIQKLDITNVVCVGGRALAFGRDHYEPPFPHLVKYKIVDVDDTEKASDAEALFQAFQGATDFIQTALDDHKNILVHCMGGISRSSSMICAYLIFRYEMSVTEAVKLVRSARPVATPNGAFVDQLEKWKSVCLTSCTSNIDASVVSNNGEKEEISISLAKKQKTDNSEAATPAK